MANEEQSNESIPAFDDGSTEEPVDLADLIDEELIEETINEE